MDHNNKLNNFLVPSKQMKNFLVFTKKSSSIDKFLKNIVLAYVTVPVDESPINRVLFLLNRYPEKSSGYREAIKEFGLKRIFTGQVTKIGYCLEANAGIFQTILKKNTLLPSIETCTIPTQFLKEKELKISALRGVAMALFFSTYNKKVSPQRVIIAAGFAGLIPVMIEELASFRFLTPSQFILLEK